MPQKSILFVDDNENIINGMQRHLRPYRDLWQMFFAASAAEALAIMAQQRIDLIVSDLLMPGMRGDELLKIVAERYPGTVRMVLSGYTDEESFQQGLEVSHQYLTKPCSADILREAIAQIFKIQACVHNPALVADIGDASQLPSLPKIYQELNQAIAAENTTTEEIAAIFARDLVLSAKLLQLVNSPYFGVNRKVSSLTEAINLIGVKKLSNLVLSVHVRNAFPSNDVETERYMDYLWQDAGRVAELARLIALSENQQQDRPDQAYLGGLLHNLGLLIFLSRGGKPLQALLEQSKTGERSLPELETTIYGFSRSEAAAYVLSLWKIPQRIIEAILLQNTPNDTDYDGVNALTAVHVAACLLQPETSSDKHALFSMSLDVDYLQRLGKLDRLPEWQKLAEKVLASSAG